MTKNGVLVLFLLALLGISGVACKQDDTSSKTVEEYHRLKVGDGSRRVSIDLGLKNVREITVYDTIVGRAGYCIYTHFDNSTGKIDVLSIVYDNDQVTYYFNPDGTLERTEREKYVINPVQVKP